MNMIALNVCPSTLQEGRRLGLAPRLIKRELDTFATELPLAKELIGRSFLSDALKRSYWLSYKYRRNTLSNIN